VAGLQTWAGAFHCGEASFTLTSDSTHADIIVREVGTLPPPPPPTRWAPALDGPTAPSTPP
jgi:hypothetical protein